MQRQVDQKAGLVYTVSARTVGLCGKTLSQDPTRTTERKPLGMVVHPYKCYTLEAEEGCHKSDANPVCVSFRRSRNIL